jgi:hypothetical protein
LLTESQVFEDEVFPGTTSADHPAQEMPEKHDHDKHFIGTVRIEPVAMSFILRVYEVLASHNQQTPQALRSILTTAFLLDHVPFSTVL